MMWQHQVAWVALTAACAAVLVVFEASGGREVIVAFCAGLGSTETVAGYVSALGPWFVVVLLALSVVASPVPGGPIALAAGALYGTVTGGLLVWAGAILGAVLAFCLSRQFSDRWLRHSPSRVAAWLSRPRSQNMLMLAVFGTRLVPFISFDAISYVAGLTSIRWWRFALATILGAAPVSFAFAAMGAGVVAQDEGWLLAAFACAVTLVLPIAAWMWHALTIQTRSAV